MAATGMQFTTAGPISATPYLQEPVTRLAGPVAAGMRVLDVGCGNGYWAGYFASLGCEAVGIDPSPTGIAIAQSTYQSARFVRMDASEAMLSELREDAFDLVISTEVIEHVYDPPSFAAGCYKALRPGGTLVLSAPYHGWAKNVVLAFANKCDFHYDALRVGGHIKFFSRSTLSRLLDSVGFVDLRFIGAGRVPLLWKSFVMSATRPTGSAETHPPP